MEGIPLGRDGVPPSPWCDLLPGLSVGRLATARGRIHYETEGSGPLLVLQSGGPGGTHQCFHPFFSRAAAFATVLYHDPLGIGGSDRPASGDYSLEYQVEEIEELRLALGGTRILLLGHSFGGLVAQLYALRHPEALAGLVLVCALPGLPGARRTMSRLNARMTEAEVLAVRDILRGGKDHAEGADGADGAEAREYRAFLAGAWKRHFLREPDEAYKARRRYEWDPDPRLVHALEAEARSLDLGGAFDPRATGQPSIPTLIVDSREDLVWCEGKVELLAANHPGAELLLCGNSAHYPFAEEPELFFAALETFMGGLDFS